MTAMPTGGPSRWPSSGFIEYWRRTRSVWRRVLPARVMLDDKRGKEMRSVHDVLAMRFRYRSDQRHYGRRDYWAKLRPVGRYLVGDCEDYCLTAQKMLRDLGWPEGALRLVLCRLPEAEAVDGNRGHMVLALDLWLHRDGKAVTYIFDCLRPFQIQDWEESYPAWRLADEGGGEDPRGQWYSCQVPGELLWRAIQ